MPWVLDRLLLAAVARAAPPRALQPGAPVHLTTVARLPYELQVDLDEPLAELRARFPNHYVYPPSTIHLTIRNLDPLTGLSDADLTEVIAESLESFLPVSLGVLGVRSGKHSAYLQLAANPSLRRLRRRLGELVPARPTLAERLRENVFVANVARFGGVPRPSVTDLRPLAVRRGSWRVDEIELVRSDHLLSASGTLSIARFKL